MPKARPPIAAVLAIALLAFVPSAGAEIVPPGNSAASQYTEAFPSPGGERETEGRKQGKVVPADVLGARNSDRLESKGKEGKAVAEFAAETAPAPVSGLSEQSGQPPSDQGGGDDEQAGGGGASSGGGGGSSEPAGADSGGSASGPATGPKGGGGAVEQPSGSSGFSEVVGQMTGSSSGKLGLWLPLIVIGAVVWSLVYFWRQRQRVV